MQDAYTCTRELMVPCFQPLEQYEYPRIVLLNSFTDIEIASHWATEEGRLIWSDKYSYHLFHIEVRDGDGNPEVMFILATMILSDHFGYR